MMSTLPLTTLSLVLITTVGGIKIVSISVLKVRRSQSTSFPPKLYLSVGKVNVPGLVTAVTFDQSRGSVLCLGWKSKALLQLVSHLLK